MFQAMRVQFRSWWSRRSAATRALPSYLGQAVGNYIRSGSGSRQAAALSYYSIFSFFPLTLLIVVAFSNMLGPAVAQEQLIRGLELFLPAATVDDFQEIVVGALKQSSSFGLVAFIALIWAATGLFTNITLSLDEIFQVPKSRSIWRQRLLAILMGVTLLLLIVASFITSGVLGLLSAFTPGFTNIWIRIGVFFLPLGLNVVIFALVFRYVPARDVHWDAIWPTAIFGAIGWELAREGFEWYLTNLANYSIIYGSIATGIVLLFWAWVISTIFLFSAQLCARLNEWMIENERRQVIMHARQGLAELRGDHSEAPQLPDVARS